MCASHAGLVSSSTGTVRDGLLRCYYQACPGIAGIVSLVITHVARPLSASHASALLVCVWFAVSCSMCCGVWCFCALWLAGWLVGWLVGCTHRTLACVVGYCLGRGGSLCSRFVSLTPGGDAGFQPCKSAFVQILLLGVDRSRVCTCAMQQVVCGHDHASFCMWAAPCLVS